VTRAHPAPRGAQLFHGPEGGVYYFADAGSAEGSDESPRGKGERPPEAGAPSQDRGEDPVRTDTGDRDPRDWSRRFSRRPAGQGIELQFQTVEEFHYVLKNSRYGLVSAGTNPSREEDRRLSEEEIKARHEALRKDLIEAGLCFTQVIGKYGEIEDSFLVMAHDIDRTDLVTLGEKYHQESVIFVDHNKNEMIYTSDAPGDDAPDTPKGTVIRGEGFNEIGPDQSDFYTEVTLESGETSRFSLEFDWDHPVPPQTNS